MKIIPPLHAVTPFICIVALSLAGCGEQTPASATGTAPATVKAKELSPAEYFAQLQKKAEAGEAEAQFSLGWIYVHGEGFTGVTFMRDVPKDMAKGFEWYEKAATQGHANAQYNLGMLYRLGLGVKENPEKAFGWLEKAAAQGNDIAQYNLGVMYADGAGVQRHLTRACAWLSLAAAQGNEKARKNLLEIDATLTPAQRDEGQQLASRWKKGEII